VVGMAYEELLKACGLTQNESLVYLSLLKVGKATSSIIVKEANISGGKIYETLEKLIQKGLVKSIIENGVKKFIANEPEMLIEYIKDKEKELHKKEEELEKILPQLKNLKEHDQQLENVSLIKGLRGVKPLIYKPLEKSKKIKIMGVTSKKEVQYNNFWRAWHNERIRLKKKAEIIFSDKDTDYWKFFKKLKYTKVKEMLSFTPSAILLVDENIFIFSYEKNLTCIHIKSLSISDSFYQFFEGLWNVAKD
jgi:sugar-specific transcriptional regulator TrmB